MRPSIYFLLKMKQFYIKILLFFCVITVISHQMSAQTLENIIPGIYRIGVKHNSDHYLDNSGYNGAAQYGKVVQWGRNFMVYQNWRIESAGENYYKITSLVSNKVLEVTDCSEANGALVRQGAWLDNDCQKWRFDELPDGFLLIVNKATGKVIEVKEGGTSTDAPIQVWDKNTNNWQRWRLEKILDPVNEFVYEARSSKKINQIVGDLDLQRNEPTLSRTYERYKLPNADLGVPFAHNGKTYLLFGDQFHTNYYRQRGAQDPIGIMDNNTNLDMGVQLDFVKYPDGRYREIVVPGVNMGPFGVGIEGVSWRNNMYIYVSNSTGDNMSYSVFAKSTDNGFSFARLYNLPATKFINVSVVKIKSDKNYPEPIGTDIQVMVGSGPYRKSQVFLAYQRADQIESIFGIKYFIGVGGDGKPRWSSRVEDATPLFDQGNVGELSLSYNEYIKKWILTYYGATFRLADDPWGAYSDAMSLFDAWLDGGYCHFMHYEGCTSGVNPIDFTIEPFNLNGGAYGPYQFEDFARGDKDNTTIYWTLSTWSPYTTVLMKSTITRNKPASHTIEPGEYMIFINKFEEYLMDNGGSGNTDVVQMTRNDSPNQTWRIDAAEPGFYKISSVQSGEVIQPKANSFANGALISQEPWTGTSLQQWRITPVQGGQFYEIRNRATNKVLEMYANQAKQWDSNGEHWQQWRIEKTGVKPGVYKIVAKHSYEVMDNRGFAGSGERSLIQKPWNGEDAQQWKVETTDDGYYKFTSLLSGEVMDLTNCSSVNGAVISQQPWQNNDCQKWDILPVAGGYMKIINKATGKVVEVNGAQSLAPVQISDWNQNTHQQDWQMWRFEFLSDLNSDTFVRDILAQENVRTYPNPVQDILNIDFDSHKIGTYILTIFDYSGRKVLEEPFELSGGMNSKQLNASRWARGLYLVTIQTQDGKPIYSKKITK